MDIREKLIIVANHHGRLLERYHALGTRIAQLTAAGCIDAREYWKDHKYLYLLYAMKNGQRKKTYVGNHPLRIEEALQKLQNYKDRISLIATQHEIQQEIGTIEELANQMLKLSSRSDLSALFAVHEEQIGDKSQLQ